MPQYAVIQSHPPDDCPMTNKAVRAFMMKSFKKAPALQKKMKIKSVLDIHLDPAHKALLILEAPSAEVARDYLVMAGYMHFVQMEFYMVSQIADLIKQVDNIPTLY